MTEQQMLYAMSHLGFFTADMFDRMMMKEKSVTALYYIEEKELKETGRFSEEQIQKWKRMRENSELFCEQYHREAEKGIRFITRLDREYPDKLRPYRGQPYGIYIAGRLPDGDQPSAAIVGARKCSSYGKMLAAKFGRELAENGVQVISGVASGIDGISQREALKAGGQSFGVLGCGTDVIYPPENADLYDMLKQRGGLISEYPSGSPPIGIHFPARNRVISGLADCLIVVEARKKSGTLITADFALDQGKTIGAVPGRAGDRLSEGCNGLIQTGAFLIQNTEDILNILGIFDKLSEKRSQNAQNSLADLEKTVYSCLDLMPKHLETIVQESGFTLSQVTEALLGLELKGLTARAGVNEYVKRLM